jgi:hypothetical protein
MQLIESVTCHLPMMLFVKVAKRNGVGENLIQILRAFGTNGFVEGDGKLGNFAVGLNLTRVLVKQWARALRTGLRIRTSV